ncbi:Cation efflux family protein [Candida albicans]|uniref:Cation efflux family protein n=1 Tax=Candida albicans TaxID=5476 RepID=A0A8H6F0I6_CANAX|nr:Cation efflux family protein [Candida albicans]
MSTSNNKLSKEISPPPPPPGQDSHSHVHSHSHDSEHSHSHSHSGATVRITWIGLLVNVTLAISKGIGGVYFHSQALVADAIHSVSDMLADFLTLATVNVAAKVGTATKFPLGYGKLETVGAFSVSAILLFAGISVGWSSLLQIFEFVLPTHLYEIASHIQIDTHSHSHGQIDPSNITTHREIPNINAAWLAGGSIIAKELLYRKTMQIAVQTNSKVLVANAWHHRVDSLTAVVALFTVAGGVLFNVAWLDSIGGIGVSILIIKAGWDSLKEAWNELIDRGEKPGSELYNKIEGIINNELQMNNELKQFKLNQLSVLSSGANTNIHMNLSTTNKNLNLQTLNQYEKRLSDLIRQDDRFVRNIFVKFDQVEEEPEKVEAKKEEDDDDDEKEVNGSNDVHSHKH